ncbi:MAG: MFS transporter [Rhodospirillales bacterium]
MAAVTGYRSIVRAFRSRQFALYTGFGIPSQIGIWMQRVAVGWMIWELTHSGTWLGVLAFADFFPTIVFSQFAGVVADRFERVRVAFVTQSAQLLFVLILLALAVTGSVTPEALVAITALSGTAASFHQPVRQTIISRIVPREDLPAAIGINSASWHGSRFVGPAIAGVVIAAWGVVPAIAINAMTYVGFLWAITRLDRLPPTPRRRTLREIPAEIAEGWVYAARHPGIGPAYLILVVSSIVGRPVGELLPGFAAAVFGRGADGLAWLTSMTGLGAMVAGLWIAQRGRVEGLTNVVALGMLGLALSLAAFTATDNLWVALPFIALVGACLTMTGSATQALVQNAVDDSVQGRILGIYGLIWLGGPALGSLVMGVLSEWVGLRWPVFGGAVICLAAWAWAHRRRARMRQALEVP